MAGVEGGKDPWFCGVEVNALDSLGASKELALKRKISVSMALLARGLGSSGHGSFRQTVGDRVLYLYVEPHSDFSVCVAGEIGVRWN